MPRHLVVILEDNADRIRDFEVAVAALGPDLRLRVWHDAPTMVAECPTVLPECCLISLDHDLSPQSGSTGDPGTGLEVSEFLARHQPVCPVIIHTSNSERRWSMHNEFRFGGWQVGIVAPIGEGWIAHSWLPRAKALIGA
ncbi:MAG: hypothetical protein KGS61_10710 [Verrucomicrobia bacterium]|nr:hypothetical protein [Verrucomicrobiota bacterium]